MHPSRWLSSRPLAEFSRELLSMLLMVASIFYYVSSAFMGAMAALYIYDPENMLYARAEVVAGIFAGMWLLGIFLQLWLNAARLLAGVETRPMIYFNERLLRFRRRRGGGR